MSKGRRKQSQGKRTPVSAESLEIRAVPSAVTSGGTVSLVDRNLTVTGTDAADNVNIGKEAGASGDQLVVTLNGTTQRFDVSAVDQILINTLAGNDRVSTMPAMPARVKTMSASPTGMSARPTIMSAIPGGYITTPMIVDGGAGDDTLVTGGGNDSVIGGDGNDVIAGGNGNDSLDGGAGNDRLTGMQGDDSLLGGDGNDLMLGDAGQDQLFGQAGDDTLEGGADADTLDGGDGTNQLSEDGTTGTDAILPRPQGWPQQRGFPQGNRPMGSFLARRR